MSEKNCIFCKIIKGEIPSKVLYESNNIIAFNDINPIAPVHVLIVPKRHIESINDIVEADKELMGEMLFVAKKIAREKEVATNGYRLIINTGKDGGQLINHLHIHLLGGKKLGSKLIN